MAHGFRIGRGLGLAIAVTVSGIAVGCSYDWTFTPASTPLDGGKDGESLDANDERPVPPLPPEPPVACSLKEACAPGFFCSFKDGVCGSIDPSGICIDISTCVSVAAACGCNGETLDPCVAAKAGVDIDKTGARCGLDTFKCPGIPAGCKRKLEYCLVKASSPNLGSCTPYKVCTGTNVTCTCSELPPPPDCSCDEVTAKPDGILISCK